MVLVLDISIYTNLRADKKRHARIKRTFNNQFSSARNSLMQNLPLVSIIIPCYNREKYISQAIDSCLTQTYQNIEIIVIDDGSSDNSVRVVESYLPKVSLIKQKNLGVSAARNRGIEASKGELLVFLDSDDWLSKDIVEQHVKTFKEYKNIDISCADSTSAASINRTIKKSNWPENPSTPLELFLLSPPPFPACEMYRASTVKKLGGYDEEMRAFADSILRIRIILSKGQVVRTKGGYATYRPVENSITKNGRKLHYYALKLIRKLKSEFSNSYEVSKLLDKRLKKHRYRYWFSTFHYHLSYKPTELIKLFWHLMKVTKVDPLFILFIVTEKPWNKTEKESF